MALAQACGQHSLGPLPCSWLDTAPVARRAWADVARAGYGLSNLARRFGIEFRHHDALHDARTAGLILLRAIEETGFDVEQWVERCRRGISSGVPIRRDGDGDGPLVGDSIVFTGALEMSRREAADLAHEAGAAVEPASPSARLCSWSAIRTSRSSLAMTKAASTARRNS